MRGDDMKGTHIAVTYNSNIYCNCCEYNCAPYKKGRMGIKEFHTKVVASIEAGYSDYINIEGGEPFLNPSYLFKYLKGIQNLNIPKYIRSNGYWGNMEPYYEILRGLKKIGLTGIIFEYDFYHSLSIYYKTLYKAIQISTMLELKTKVIAFFQSENLSSIEDRNTFDYMKRLKSDFKDIEFDLKVINRKKNAACNYICYKKSS